MKKCLYCQAVLDENCIVDFCERCGKNVWGEKMFNAIIQNMEEARENGIRFKPKEFENGIEGMNFLNVSACFFSSCSAPFILVANCLPCLECPL